MAEDSKLCSTFSHQAPQSIQFLPPRRTKMQQMTADKQQNVAISGQTFHSCFLNPLQKPSNIYLLLCSSSSHSNHHNDCPTPSNTTPAPSFFQLRTATSLLLFPTLHRPRLRFCQPKGKFCSRSQFQPRGRFTHRQHRRRQQPPGEELQEDHHHGVVHAGLSDPLALQSRAP